MGYDIEAILIEKYKYFIIKSNNKYTINTIIGPERLLNLLMPYAKNNIIYLTNILLMKDINNKKIDYTDIYELLDSILMINKLSK